MSCYLLYDLACHISDVNKLNDISDEYFKYDKEADYFSSESILDHKKAGEERYKISRLMESCQHVFYCELTKEEAKKIMKVLDTKYSSLVNQKRAFESLIINN